MSKFKGQKDKIKLDENLVTNENLVFSFKYLQLTEKFCISKYKTTDDVKSFIDRLKNLCLNDVIFLKTSRSKSLRVHPINFWDRNVSESSFWMPNEDMIIWEWAYQIQISCNNWRLHGFFTKNIFNIVWIDPEHLLYPWK